MSATDNSVSVLITAETRTPTQKGFGTSMILAYHTVYQERVRAYSDLTSMISDGFTTKDAAYRGAAKIFSQNPSAPLVKIGRTANDTIKKLKLTPNGNDLRSNHDYIVTINDLEAKYTSGASPTVATVVAGLKIAIDALSQEVDTTDNGTDLSVDAKTVADWFSFYVADHNLLHLQDITADGTPNGIADDLAAIQLEDDDFYFPEPTNKGKAVLEALAAAVQGKVKLMVTSSADHDIIESGTTDVLSVMNTAGYDRTALMYHPRAGDQFPGIGWVGKCSPYDPGSLTWKFKSISGADVTTLGTTERGYIINKKGNFYHRTSGLSITEEGWTTSGQFIDITRSIDFLTARIQEGIFGFLVGSLKVPMTDKGITMIEGELQSILKISGVDTGILAEDPPFTITTPKMADISTADKTARYVNKFTFTGYIQGAVHKVKVEGTLLIP